MKVLFFLPCSLFCLLSPFEESKREIITILNHKQLAPLTKQEAINTIVKKKYGYLLSFPSCSIKAIIKSKKNDKIGPPDLQITFKTFEKKNKC